MQTVRWQRLYNPMVSWLLRSPLHNLSEGYAAATTDAQRAMFLAAGEALLATFNGTALHLSINLFSIYFLIVSAVMLRSSTFGRVTAYMGILAAIFNWAGQATRPLVAGGTGGAHAGRGGEECGGAPHVGMARRSNSLVGRRTRGEACSSGEPWTWQCK
jgi:hypothetical protein